MVGLIRTVAVATLMQIIVVAGLVVYMSNHDQAIARQYAQTAELNSRAFTEAKVIELYSRISEERAHDREMLNLWLDTAIDRKLLEKRRP